MVKSQFLYGLGGKMKFNAGNKAVEDIFKIAQNLGYTKIYYIKRNSHQIIRVFKWIYCVLMCLLRSNKILLQYPITSSPRIDKKLTKLFADLFGRNVTVIVHDLNSYRFTGILDANEISTLNYANNLLVHTSKMRDFLNKAGIPENKMSIIGAFPYLISKKNIIQRIKFDEIVFAGNLDKSKFLQPLSEFALTSNIRFNLYGSETNKIVYNHNVKYMGRFVPDDVSNIQGKWGLVWDGDSLDTCSGKLGNYMKINSPHKVSLYIAAELPIIIWSGCALAPYVVDNKLGIAINSFSELSDKIKNIPESVYEDMLNRIKEYSLKITSGENLKITFRSL